MRARQVGRVAGLYRYPVKSMRGEAVRSAKVWWHGFEGDRRYAFVRAKNQSRFPWLTAREVPALLTYHPSFVDSASPAASAVLVTTPDDRTLPITDSQLRHELEALADEPLSLLHLGRGAFDSAGVSLLTTAALRTLGAAVASGLTPQRFRPNIVVEPTVEEGYPEDQWVGCTLSIGARPDAPRIRLVRPIPRCAIVNLDPLTAVQELAILRAVVQHHHQHLGVYGATEQVGTATVGDPVLLWESA